MEDEPFPYLKTCFLCVFISINFFVFFRSICLALGHMNKNASYYQILMIPGKIETHTLNDFIKETLPLV